MKLPNSLVRAPQLLLCGGLLTFAAASVGAERIPCVLVAPEVRASVRAAGACSDPGSEIREQPTPQTRAAPGTTPGQGKARSGTPTPKPTQDTDIERVVVPNLVGVMFDDTRAKLQGFSLERFDRASQAPAGQIIEQFPQASASMVAGGRIAVVVSSGPPTMQLPSVINRSYDDATDALSAFSVVRVEVPGTAPKGQVVAQEPAPGAAVHPASRVALQVSDGTLATAAVAAPAINPTDPEPVRPSWLPLSVDGRIALMVAVASLLFGTAVGALSMRQWRQRHKLAQGDAVSTERVAPTLVVADDRAPPAVSEPVVRFLARLDAGETRIQFPHVAEYEEPAKEYVNDRNG